MTAPPSLLLVEPHFVLRHTVVAVANELGLARIVEATSLDSAGQQLSNQAFDGCVISLGDDRREVDLIRSLRAGGLASQADVPVAVMTADCDAGMVVVLKELNVSRIVLKPFKVKTILETISQLLARPA
jgi:DNA-binding NarL/FixJ family response regulator